MPHAGHSGGSHHSSSSHRSSSISHRSTSHHSSFHSSPPRHSTTVHHIHHYSGYTGSGYSGSGYSSGGNYSYSSTDDSISGWTILIVIVIAALVFIAAIVLVSSISDTNYTGYSDYPSFPSYHTIGGKTKISGEYTVPEYLRDEANHFGSPTNKNTVIEGLKYFHEKTGVPLVLITTNYDWSDKEVYEEYLNIGDDEGHAVIAFNPNWNSENIWYWCVGDISASVIDQYEIDYLESQLGISSNASEWYKTLVSFTNQLMGITDANITPTPPVEANPVTPETVETNPVETVGTEMSEAKPAETEVAELEPVETMEAETSETQSPSTWSKIREWAINYQAFQLVIGIPCSIIAVIVIIVYLKRHNKKAE